MPNRGVSIVVALFVALAVAIGAAPRFGAASAAGSDCRATCCGGDCRCGDACDCAVDREPAAPDDAPALPEGSRGERAPLVAVPTVPVEAVTRSEPIDLGARCAASGGLAAPPSCRLRLALVSRWTI